MKLSNQVTQAGSLQVKIYEEPSAIAGAWKALEATALGTVFQSYAWASAWCRTAAESMGEEPVIACWSDPVGAAVIWPMALTTWRGARILTWLGQGYTNYNMGLYRDGIAVGIDAARLQTMEADLRRLVPQAVAFHLIDQPAVWNGCLNPHAMLPHVPSANISYEMRLQKDPEALFKSALSSDTRRRLGRLERRLKEKASVEFGRAETREQRLQCLSVFVQQKAAQLKELGVRDVFAPPAIRNFYGELFTETSGASFDCAYLKAGEEFLATSNGMRFQDRFYHLTLSMKFERDGAQSPGRLLSRHIIAQQCRLGTAIFDFGPGTGRHKLAWHPEPIAYFETYRSLAARGVGVTALRRLMSSGRRHALTSRWFQKGVAKLKQCKSALTRRPRSISRSDGE